MIAALLECLVERHRMLGQLDVVQFRRQAIMNILGCHRAKGFPCLAGLKRKIKDQLVDLAGELLRGG